MSKITIEDYKRAIRAKYKIAIEEDVSGILSNPKPAEFRDFYFRIFEKGLEKIDKEIMEIFFEANNNSPLKKAIENCNTGKLKPIISFLQGGNTENGPRIEMAAILVNLKPRPFKKFEENGGMIEENRETEKTFHSPQGFFTSEKEEKEENQKNGTEVVGKKVAILDKPTDKSPSERFNKKLKLTIAGIMVVFCLGFIISYYFYPKKQCMQWSGDHYEKVDCELNVNGIMTSVLEPFDEIKFELKKVTVCDTTTCFKNGKPIIWYAKTGDAADFFNTHGIHPENEKALRPVTQYIFNKYKKPCGSK